MPVRAAAAPVRYFRSRLPEYGRSLNAFPAAPRALCAHSAKAPWGAALIDCFGRGPILVLGHSYPVPASGRHPKPSIQVHHVTKLDQPGTMGSGDYCGRFEHSACIADLKQRRELFTTEL